MQSNINVGCNSHKALEHFLSKMNVWRIRITQQCFKYINEANLITALPKIVNYDSRVEMTCNMQSLEFQSRSLWS